MLNIIRHARISNIGCRSCSTAKENVAQDKASNYEPVFSFPFIKYIAVLNRLKVYQIVGSTIAIPSCGIMEAFNTLPSGAFLSASYIGKSPLAFDAPFMHTIKANTIISINMYVL